MNYFSKTMILEGQRGSVASQNEEKHIFFVASFSRCILAAFLLDLASILASFLVPFAIQNRYGFRYVFGKRFGSLWWGGPPPGGALRGGVPRGVPLGAGIVA